MRVLHLSSEDSWRGGEQQIIYLVEESLKKNVEAFIACKEDSELEFYCKSHNVPFVSLPFRSAYDMKTARKIVKICLRQKVDLIQTHSSKSHTMAVIAGLIGLNIPQILTRRVDFPVKGNWFSRYKYNYKKIARIICVSDVIKNMISKDIIDERKLVTIHDGVDLHKFDDYQDSNWLREEYNLGKETTIIGNTSAISHQKDYGTFVLAAEKILSQKGNVHFFIVGEGPQRKKIQTFIKKKNLRNKITMTGFRKNIREVLPSVDIFLFTSQTEGLGTTLLDAMAARVPIVATSAGGVPELIIDGKNGLLSPVKDFKSLSHGVVQLMNTPKLGDDLANAGVETVRNFSKERTTELTLQLYEEIVNEGFSST